MSFWNDLGKRLDELAGAVERLSPRVRALEDNYDALEKKYNALVGRLAEVDRLATDTAAKWTAEKHPGKQTEDDNRHHDLAAEYTGFRDGEVFSLAIAPTRDHRILNTTGQAYVCSGINQALFGSANPAPGELRAVLDSFGINCPDEELDQLCRQAVHLTARARKLGRDQRWDFDRGDGRFDPTRQTRSPGSAIGAPDEIVAIVVAPGYVVGNGMVVVPQQVLTTRNAALPTGSVPSPQPQPGCAPQVQPGAEESV
jgi:hypothetical protein